MPSIFPELINGALVIRDEDGNCLLPPGVENAYCPPEDFVTSCLVTALPSDCTARLSAAQMNAIVSEMLCFAATLNPNGAWDCDNLCNIGEAFSAWAAENKLVDGTTIIGAGTLADKWRVSPAAVVTAICGAASARLALADCLIDDTPGNQVVIGALQGLYVAPAVPPSFSAFIATETNVASDIGLTQNVWTDVPMASNSFKGTPFGAFASPTFTFSAAGTYVLLSTVPLQNLTNGGSNPFTASRALFNGATPEMLSFNAPGGVSSGTGQFHHHVGHFIFDAAVNDTIKLQAWANNGTNGLIIRTVGTMLGVKCRLMLVKIR